MLLETARKFFLAGLGAAMLAQDEMVDLANKLVERGEATQEKRRKMVDDFVSERRKQSKEAVKRAEKDFGKQMEQVLHRLNMPTRSEVKALNRKITRLTKKVDELNKASA
jgi:poly(hydroxyalkanoate) granule-associated protein